MLKEGGSRAGKRVGFRAEGRCERIREEGEEGEEGDGDELVVEGKKKDYCSWSNKKKKMSAIECSPILTLAILLLF